jgi:membrane protein
LAQGKPLWNTPKAVWRVASSAYDRFERHDGTAMAGFIAFSTFLSLFPFAIFFSALAGILIGPEDSRAVFDALFDLVPEHMAKTLQPVLDDVIGKSRGGVLTISALGAVWVASNAVEAIRVAFDRAYEAQKPRHFIPRRLLALAFVVLASITFTILGFVIILAPLAMRLFQEFTGIPVPFELNYARYGVGVPGFALFLYALNRFLPSRAPKGWGVTPGIAVSTVLWLLGASLFSVYLAFAPSYTVTYGAFAGVIVTLLFFYLTGAVLIFGAEVNATLMAQRGDVQSQTEEVI